MVDSVIIEAPPWVANLTALALVTGRPSGALVFVGDQNEPYELDKANAFAIHPTLIVAAAGGGRWFRRSKKYVIGNFTLWCQSWGYGIVGYTPGQLLASGSTEPDISLDLRAFKNAPGGNQQCVATDKDGNVWFGIDGWFPTVLFIKTDVMMFALEDCLKSGTPKPRHFLPVPLGGKQTEAAVILFDKAGNLWSGMGEHGTFGYTQFQKYHPSQFDTADPPRLTLQQVPPLPGPAPTTSNQQDAVFDRDGNLWSSIGFGGAANGGILKYTAAQVAAGGVVLADVIWTGSNFTGAGLGATCQMALSPDGARLWVADYSGNKVVKAWNIAGAVSGNPAPAITLTSASFNGGPYSLAFDLAGNLWVNNGNENRLMRIPAAQLVASGNVTPDIVITPVTAVLTSKMTFPNNPDRSGV